MATATLVNYIDINMAAVRRRPHAGGQWYFALSLLATAYCTTASWHAIREVMALRIIKHKRVTGGIFNTVCRDAFGISASTHHRARARENDAVLHYWLVVLLRSNRQAVIKPVRLRHRLANACAFKSRALTQTLSRVFANNGKHHLREIYHLQPACNIIYGPACIIIA